MAFLTTLGIEREVDCVVDINPYKQGKYLPGTGHEVDASGRVVRVEEKPDGTYEAAIRILEMSTSDQAWLEEYLREGNVATKR